MGVRAAIDVSRLVQAGAAFVMIAMLPGTGAFAQDAPVFTAPAVGGQSSFGDYYGFQYPGQSGQPNPIVAFDPNLLPRLRFDPQLGLTTETTPGFFAHMQTLPETQQQAIFQIYGGIGNDSAVGVERNLSWFSTDLTSDQNRQLNDLIARAGTLSEFEQKMLQDLLNQAIVVPLTPMPEVPTPTRPPLDPVIPVATSCADGKPIPSYCQADAAKTLPACQCMG